MTSRDIEIRLVTMGGAIRRVLRDAKLTSLSWKLNNFGQANYEMLTTDKYAGDAARLHERDWEVQVWMDGELVWWGVPMTDAGGPGQLQIGADGLFSYFEDRVVGDQTLEWLGIDQFTILTDLVLYAQSEASQLYRNFNIGVSIPGGPSGFARYQRYERAEHAILANLIREWSTIKNGFDFDIIVTPDGSRNIRPYTPKKGTTRPDLMLEYGKNMSNYTWNRSALPMRTQTFMTGGAVPNSETGKMEAVYENVTASQKYGVIQNVVSEGNQMDPDWLGDRAEEDVRKGAKPDHKVTVTQVDVRDIQFFGEVETGDWVPVRIRDGYRVYDGMNRVGEITWNADETLSLGFVEEEAA